MLSQGPENANANINTPVNDALFNAITENKVEEAIRLITAGIDVEATDCNGKSPLYCAAEHNQIKILEELIASGANKNVLLNGKTPLFRAIELDHTKVAVSLLKHNADLQYLDDSVPLLHIAIKRSNLTVVEALIDRGVDIEKFDDSFFSHL